jgi:hypothetical protein
MELYGAVAATGHVNWTYRIVLRVAKVIAVAGVVAVSAIAVVLYQQRIQESPSVEQRNAAASSSHSKVEHLGLDPRQVVTPAHAKVQDRSDYAKDFSESHNYLDFARATIKAARSGNSDAQYYLGKAMRLCDESRQTFRFNSQEISLDEALSRYSSGRTSARKIKLIYERCHDLEAVGDRERQFGNSEDWIKSASDKGQPVAESDEALQGFLAIQRSAVSSTAASDFNALTKSGGDPRALLLAAVQTKDPEALFIVGEAQGYLNNFGVDATKNELAWWLVACQRGLPCDSNSEFQLDVALNDGLLEELSGPDLICAMAGKDCQDVERRAQEINEKLNARSWSELGLQSRALPETAGMLLSDTITR